MTRDEKCLAEKKLLLAIYGAEVFEGQIVRQVQPSCCGQNIDLIEAKVAFREVEIRSKIFTFIEPFCPICGMKVSAIYQFIN